MSAAPALTADSRPLRFAGLWLLSSRADLAVLFLPVGLTLAAAFAAVFAGEVADGPSQRLAVWTAQNILGNGTHVVLSFVLLAARRDVREASPGQLPRIAAGSAAMLLVGLGFFALYATDTTARMFVIAALFNIFGLHHILSQSKGLWALHDLKARASGLPGMADRERSLLTKHVPVCLSLVLVRLFFVAGEDGTPYLDLGQSPVLPAWCLAPLLLGWLLWSFTVLRTVTAGGATSGPKLIYLAVHLGAVGLTLSRPALGNILLPAMHGLEYFALSAKMLEPRDNAEQRAFPTRLIWPTMLLAMLPMFAIGLGQGLFDGLFGPSAKAAAFASLAPTSTGWRLFSSLGLGVVLAHYLTDAFIYRFSIPGIRKVMLRRLGLG